MAANDIKLIQENSVGLFSERTIAPTAQSLLAFDSNKMPTAVPFPTGMRNRLFNGDMSIWQRGTSSSSISTTRTYLPDRWAITTGASTLTSVQRSTSVPTGSRAKYSLELNGATSVTTVDIDQRMESLFIPAIKRTITYSARIYNGAGADFTPQLRIRQANAGADTWSGTPDTGLSFTNLQTCTNAQWTTISWSGDVSGYTNLDNGAEFTLRIPSGSLTSGKTVRITEIQLEEGSVTTAFEVLPPTIQLSLCQRYFFNAINGNSQDYAIGYDIGSTSGFFTRPFPVPMRVAPSLSVSSASHFIIYPDSVTPTSLTAASAISALMGSIDIAAASGLTAKSGSLLRSQNSSARMDFSAEL